VIAWRIATYHIPLVIMWICLMKITIGKGSITKKRPEDSKAGKDSDNGSNVSTNGENKTESPKNYSSNKSPENFSAAAWSESNDDPQHNLRSYTNSFSSSHAKEMSYLTKEENKSQPRIGKRGVEGKNAEVEDIMDMTLETKSTRSPSNIPKHFDNVSKKDNINSIKNDNNQKNLRKKDKTDDSEKGKD